MLPPGNLLAFCLVAIPIILVPGPSVLFVIGRSLSLGRVGGLLSVVGNAAGAAVAVVAVALGVGIVIAQSVVVFTIVKIVGAAYLIYLGVPQRAASARPAGAGRRLRMTLPPRYHASSAGHVRARIHPIPPRLRSMLSTLPTRLIEHRPCDRGHVEAQALGHEQAEHRRAPVGRELHGGAAAVQGFGAVDGEG